MTLARGARVWLRSLAIRDFRNLERVDLDIPAAGLAIVGNNGQGKTNLLEAIYYLQTLRSARGARDSETTRFGTGGFHISGKADTPELHEISVGFDRQAKKKKAVVDGVAPRRLSDALGALPSVMFSPTDLDLVGGSPAVRRRFLDLTLALTSRKYLHALQHYRANLLQRNAALRDATKRGASDARVAVWEPALAEHGALLVAARARWVLEWAPGFRDLCAQIGEQAPVGMRYSSPCGEVLAQATPLSAAKQCQDALVAALAEKRPLDLRRGLTHVGPHRDELELTLDGREMRTFASAGQQRTAAIALRMLEATTIKHHSGAEPLFLLDDPFAELDGGRAERILGLLQEGGIGQTILAVPRASDIPRELMKLDRVSIRNGSIDRKGDVQA